MTSTSPLSRPPAVKFKDLQEVVTSKVRYNLMPFDVRADFVRVTSDTVLVPVTVQVKNRDITFLNKDGIQRGVVNIFGRVTTLTGRPAVAAIQGLDRESRVIYVGTFSKVLFPSLRIAYAVLPGDLASAGSLRATLEQAREDAGARSCSTSTR